MLTFVIPTYNRPEHLKRAVASITEQIEDGMDVDVRIVENCRDESVREVVNSLSGPRVTVTSHPHGDYSDAFRAMFRAAPESEWVWTFGDDDVLQPGALKFMLGKLAEWENLSFVHVSEKKRASGKRGLYYAGSLLQLCSTLGWIEMTGFISGNITRGALLAKAAETPHWKTYAKNAFVQSCALLEALKDEPCAFMEVPVIDSQEQEQTGDTMKTWAEQNIGGRYLLVADALDCMYENGVLTDKLPAPFFRYLNLHLWERFLVYFINDFFDKNALWADDAWARTIRLASYLKDEEAARKIVSDLEKTKGMMTLSLYLDQNLHAIRTAIGGIGEQYSKSSYPTTFTEPAKPDTQPEPSAA